MRRRLYGIMAAVAVGFVLYQPFASREDLSEDIESAYRTLIKYRAAAQDTQGSGTGLKDAEEELTMLEKGLLPGPTDARAVARLQTEVSGLATKAGLSISSVRPLNPTDRPPYQEITVQVNLSGTLLQLRDFLRALEESETLLRVTSLNVRVNKVSEPDSLRMKVAISGIMKV